MITPSNPASPNAIEKNVPNAEIHVLEARHLALDNKADEIADLAHKFMSAGS